MYSNAKALGVRVPEWLPCCPDPPLRQATVHGPRPTDHTIVTVPLLPQSTGLNYPNTLPCTSGPPLPVPSCVARQKGDVLPGSLSSLIGPLDFPTQVRSFRWFCGSGNWGSYLNLVEELIAYMLLRTALVRRVRFCCKHPPSSCSSKNHLIIPHLFVSPLDRISEAVAFDITLLRLIRFVPYLRRHPLPVASRSPNPRLITRNSRLQTSATPDLTNQEISYH